MTVEPVYLPWLPPTLRCLAPVPGRNRVGAGPQAPAGSLGLGFGILVDRPVNWRLLGGKAPIPPCQSGPYLSQPGISAVADDFPNQPVVLVPLMPLDLNRASGHPLDQGFLRRLAEGWLLSGASIPANRTRC